MRSGTKLSQLMRAFLPTLSYHPQIVLYDWNTFDKDVKLHVIYSLFRSTLSKTGITVSHMHEFFAIPHAEMLHNVTLYL